MRSPQRLREVQHDRRTAAAGSGGERPGGLSTSSFESNCFGWGGTPRHPLVLGGSSNQLQKNLGGRNCPRNRRARAQRFETEKASSHGMSAAQTPTEATEAAGPTFPTILHVNLALRAS